MKVIITKNGSSVLSEKFLREAGVDDQIRLAENSDADSLAIIESRCFNPVFYDSLLTAKKVRYIVNDGNGLLLVYYTNQKAVGYAQMNFHQRSNIGHFYSLAVVPECQNGQAAKSLFIAIEMIGRQLLLDGIKLEIREDNRALHRRYIRTGYMETSRSQNYYPDGCSAIHMLKKFESDPL